MFVALMLERSRIPLGMPCQNDIGTPNTCVATPTRLRWTAADKPWGPAPMTATSRSGTRFALATGTSVASARRAVSVISSSTVNSDTSLDCEIGQKCQLGEAWAQIVEREDGLDVEHS